MFSTRSQEAHDTEPSQVQVLHLLHILEVTRVKEYKPGEEDLSMESRILDSNDNNQLEIISLTEIEAGSPNNTRPLSANCQRITE